MERYTDLVLEHFQNPRNVGVIPNPDGEALATNPVCGDTMKLTLQVQSEVILDAKFQTVGCAAAIATSSVATEMFKGKTIAQAVALTKEEIAAALGGLPPGKMHCSVLATDALRKALENYRQRHRAAAS